MVEESEEVVEEVEEVIELPLERADGLPRVRQLVGDRLAGRFGPDLTETVQLVLSELMSNALLHGRPPFRARLRLGPERVRLEVEDASPALPVRPVTSDTSMTGRGLALVSRLADRCGVEPSLGDTPSGGDPPIGGGTPSGGDRPSGRGTATGEGKTVWAELATTGRHDLMPNDVEIEGLYAERPATDNANAVTVTLGDVPTDLLIAAKTHVDNLIREFALMAGGAASGSSGRVPDSLASLIERVTTRFAHARESIKRQALQAAKAGQERTRLQLQLPVSAADAGEEYLAALDEADSYARAARLLTLETPPQHRAFRTWYVTSLVDQLRAVAKGARPPPVRPFERYLLDALDVVAAAQRVADRGARLQKVTAALAEATTPEQVADAILAEGAQALGASGASLLLDRGRDSLAVPGAFGYPAELVEAMRAERRDARLPAAEALRTGQAVWVASRAERDARFPELARLEPATLSICALPLVARGEVVAALRFSFDTPRLFDDEERRFARSLAGQAVVALERARLLTEERAARGRLAFLAQASDVLAQSLEPDATVQQLPALLVPALADWAVVYLPGGADPPELAAVAHRDGNVTARLRDQAGNGLDIGTAEVLAGGRAVRYDRVPEEVADRAVRHLDPQLAAAVRPAVGLATPLRWRDQLVGAVGLARVTPEPYTDDEVRVISEVAGRAAVAVVNARQFARERENALTLQQSLLPRVLPRRPGVDLAWRYLPAEAGSLVGGDWYDVLPQEGDQLALIIGDVMGRGLQAAAVMGQLRAAARVYATGHAGPGTVLAELDAAAGRLEHEQLTTAALAVLDPPRQTLTVATAGHLPPLLLPPEAAPRLLDLDPGPPLGVGKPPYPETTVDFPAGSMLLMFTDGLVEGHDRPIDVGLNRLVRAAAGAESAEELCDRALDALAPTGGPDDDTALLAVAVPRPVP